MGYNSRRREMKYFIILFFILSFLVFPQQAEKADVQEQPEQEEIANQSEDESRLQTQPGDFIYTPMGRRDPFWDLLQGRNIRGNREAIEGIPGLMIDELDLGGIIFSEGSYKAMVVGPDNMPYVIKVGDNVYDGEVIKIDNSTVTFRKILTVALGGKKERIIVKRISPEEEKQK
jgi:Tfp pilus assembly protein PilP